MFKFHEQSSRIVQRVHMHLVRLKPALVLRSYQMYRENVKSGSKSQNKLKFMYTITDLSPITSSGFL